MIVGVFSGILIFTFVYILLKLGKGGGNIYFRKNSWWKTFSQMLCFWNMLEGTNIFCTIVNDCSGSLRSPENSGSYGLESWYSHHILSNLCFWQYILSRLTKLSEFEPPKLNLSTVSRHILSHRWSKPRFGLFEWFCIIKHKIILKNIGDIPFL